MLPVAIFINFFNDTVCCDQLITSLLSSEFVKDFIRDEALDIGNNTSVILTKPFLYF